MTISIEIGKLKVNLRHQSMMGYREREVELLVMWHSCGVYDVSYYRPHDAENHEIMVAEDWYPPNAHVSFTPEQFEKVAELYAAAPKHPRNECYKPFYEDYLLSIGMFDLGDDTLFQAFKDPQDERIYMVDRYFTYGLPTTTSGVLGLSIEDFKRLKDLIDSKKGEIFYSGCKMSWPPKSKD